MTRRRTAAIDTDAVGVRGGRLAPTWTDIHDWVIYSGVSPHAIALYVILRSHVNRERGDELVWTSALTLAVMMGLSRGDKITPYVDELEALGAIDVIRGGMNNKNEYVVHALPPKDYKGPLNGRAWYEMHKKLLELKRAAEKAIRDARRTKQRAAKNAASGEQKASSKGVTPKTGEQAVPGGVTPKTGEPVTPKTGEPVTPKTGREPRRVFEPTEGETTPTPPSSSSPPEWAVTDPEEEEKIESSTGQAAKPADAGSQLTEWELALHAELMQIRPTWSPPSLREVLADKAIRERPDRELVRQAFLIGAETRKTITPRRLLHDTCPHWEQAFQKLHGDRADAAADTRPEKRAAAPGMYQGPVGRPAAAPTLPAAPTAEYLEAKAQATRQGSRKTDENTDIWAVDRLRAVADEMAGAAS